MDKRCINIPDGPPQAGPYSHAVAAGGFIHVSGQIPINPDGKVIRGPIREQVRLALENLRRVLEGAGSSLEHVVRVNVYLLDMRDFAVFNEVYAEFFPQNCPARSCVQVARLPKDVEIEVDAVAIES
jgi:2-iminobutanoate/2-iminopropanoate deaminase